MSYWKLVVPEATTNYILNPQFWNNITDGWTDWNGTHTMVSNIQYIGISSYRITADGAGVNAWAESDPVEVADGEDVTLSVRLLRSVSISSSIAIYDDTNNMTRATATPTTAGIGEWELLTCSWNNDTGGAVDVTARVINSEQNSTSNIWFDAAQLELKDHYTTFCDGTRDGCEWNGSEHNSTSSRSAQSRAGGRVYDFEDDYNFNVVDFQGYGVPPHLLNLDSYAILPGAQVNSVKADVNTLTLTGYFKDTTLATFHGYRQALAEELAHDRYPKTAEGWQPVRIRYTGGDVEKEAHAFYDSGLEGNAIRGRYSERLSIRLLLADPYWYELGESANNLDTNDSATLRYLGGRLRSTGQWDALGLSADPTADGTIWAICAASDGSIYFGGDFDGINNDSPAGGDYIIRYDPADESWNLLVGAGDVTDVVFCISEGPDGLIYIGGLFTAVNGDGTADYIVAYDPSTDTWSSLGDPDSGTAAIVSVRSMAWDSEGNLYVGGSFTDFANVGNADYFAKWNGTAWSAVGSGGTAGTVMAIAIDSRDNIYIGGTFTNWAGDGDADYWAWWNGSAWAAVDDIALNGDVYTMMFNDQDELFVGGAFTQADGVNEADCIFKWTGTAVEVVDNGTDDYVYHINIGPDGLLWAGGEFTVAGSISVVDRIAVWNGSTWAPLDLNLSGTPNVYALDFGPADPVLQQNYDVYIGCTTTGTAYFAGDATVTNDGTASQYPILYFKRAGGTSARLVSVRNWTTGQELFCDYSLLKGESITIDCRPGKKSITSNFFGRRPKAILPNSDFGSFAVQPGDNLITAFVDVSGAPTIRGHIIWRDMYRGID